MITSIEAKKIMMADTPIIYEGIEYKKISSLIFTKIDKKFYVCAELLSKNANSVTIVRIDHIDREIQKKQFENIDISNAYYQEMKKNIKVIFFALINSLHRKSFNSALKFCEDLNKNILELNNYLKEKIEEKIKE